MSVMVIDQDTINRAFNTAMNICFDAPIHWGSVNTHDALKRFNLEYLARWSAIFNERNYNRRYAHHKPWSKVTYRWQRFSGEFIERDELAQAITTIRCLRYNILDYYEDAPQYKTLTDLVRVLESIFMDTSPEFKAAEWGCLEKPYQKAIDKQA